MRHIQDFEEYVESLLKKHDQRKDMCTIVCLYGVGEKEIEYAKTSSKLARDNLNFMRSRLRLTRLVLLNSFESRYASLERSHLVMKDSSSNQNLQSVEFDVDQTDFLSFILTVPGGRTILQISYAVSSSYHQNVFQNLSLKTLCAVPSTSKFEVTDLLGNLR